MLRLILIIFLLPIALTAQNAKLSPQQYLLLAESLQTVNEPDAALQTLEKAVRENPKHTGLRTTLARAWYDQLEFKKAISIVTPLMKARDATDEVWVIAANSYYLLEKGARGRSILLDGLEKFPKSGKLHFVMGISENIEGREAEALEWFEKGIEKDPWFATNYYWAHSIHSEQGNRIWGIIYAEIYLNLDRKSDMNLKMSSHLFDIWKASFNTSNPAGPVFIFTDPGSHSISPKSKQLSRFENQFDEIYNQALREIHPDSLTIESLSAIRNRAASLWEAQSKFEPFSLAKWYAHLKTLQYDQAYDFWLLYAGNELEFEEWQQENAEGYARFEDWFARNPISQFIKNPVSRLRMNRP